MAPRGTRCHPRGLYAPSRERARLNSEFISALLRDFRQGGPKAIERVGRTQPSGQSQDPCRVIRMRHKVPQLAVSCRLVLAHLGNCRRAGSLAATRDEFAIQLLAVTRADRPAAAPALRWSAA